MAVASDYLDSIRIIWIGGFWYKVGNEFAKMFVDMFAVGDACDIEPDIVQTLITLILRPYTYVVAFVFDAEITEFLDGSIFAAVRTDG